MKLRFTPRAVQDIAAIADYIRERNPGAAERVRAAILQSLQNLVLFPQVGRARRTRARGQAPRRSNPSRHKKAGWIGFSVFALRATADRPLRNDVQI